MKWRDGITFEKDPDSTEPRGISWVDYLAAIASNETISTSVYSVTAGITEDVDDGTPLTLGSASIVTGAKKTQVRYSAGSVGQTYKVTNRITTNTGITDDRSFYVAVRER